MKNTLNQVKKHVIIQLSTVSAQRIERHIKNRIIKTHYAPATTRVLAEMLEPAYIQPTIIVGNVKKRGGENDILNL